MSMVTALSTMLLSKLAGKRSAFSTQGSPLSTAAISGSDENALPGRDCRAGERDLGRERRLRPIESVRLDALARVGRSRAEAALRPAAQLTASALARFTTLRSDRITVVSYP